MSYEGLVVEAGEVLVSGILWTDQAFYIITVTLQDVLSLVILKSS